ncbi:hypothetical protein B0P06_002816 [Clostridium saccharoperbutylacetonicum]|nr:hypothetical protein [Clostridium saccharoperbutylacetonicum]NRT60361.1 hypothetical protein [Clostridium saccharoperbutylacetonicum]NSB23673.1 hypothetical protein [Clostridium saccharoperbutylacetonicum]NSB43045.1 hypothetical protein [Clostridium saccharoperbutylacetonicum]
MFPNIKFGHLLFGQVLNETSHRGNSTHIRSLSTRFTPNQFLELS